MAEAKKPAPQAEAADSGGKKKKNTVLYVVIILLIVVILGVGGVVAWLLFKPDASYSDANGGDDQTSEHAKDKKGKAADKKKAADEAPIFEKLDTYTVNLQGGQVLQTEIDVRLSSEKQKEVIKNFLPRISSQVNLLLGSKKPEDVATTEGKLKLIAELKQSINKALGAKDDEDGVMEVDLKTFIVQ